jgi:hypothetical protein
MEAFSGFTPAGLTTPALRAGSSASGVGRRVASPRGFEGGLKTREAAQIAENSADRAHEGTASHAKQDTAASALASSDPVETALADALQRAALAGAWDAVAALTAELRARREARAKVVDLAAERERRGR